MVHTMLISSATLLPAHLFSFVILIIFTMMIIRTRRRTKSHPLPPGSMGWPIVGETFALYSQHPNTFFASRVQTHGEIFKTRILGYPCAVMARPDAARFVLLTHSHLFKPTYPTSKERIIGPSALFFHQGPYHARLHKLVHSSLSPLALRPLLPAIESAAAATLRSWTGNTLPSFPALKNFAFDVGVLAIFGGNFDKHVTDELRQNYLVVDKGYNSFPSRMPGTPYRKAVKARRRLADILRGAVEERRRSGEKTGLLGGLMEERGGTFLTEEQISDNIIGVLFAAQDTTASAITWAVKYLHDYPRILKAVKVVKRFLTSLTVI